MKTIAGILIIILLPISALVGCGGSGETASGSGQLERGPRQGPGAGQERGPAQGQPPGQVQAGTSFTRLFARTFFHPRCVACHAFAEGGISARRHRGRSTNCSTCHTQDDWRASPVSMTFTGRSASTICRIAANRRGGTDALAELLRTSPHVRWAVAEGDVPGGQRLRLAPPGNQQAWLNIIDQWVAGGSTCS